MLLSELIDRDVAIEWPEAVALVRAVLEQVHGSLFPEWKDVQLLPSGTIEVHSGRPVSDPVKAAGRMLQSLMSRADPPVQLRLLTAQTYASTGEFHEALGFFERPNRQAVLVGLATRAAAAAVLPQPHPGGESTIPYTPEVQPEPTDGSQPSRSPSRAVVLAACSAVVLLMLGSGSWLAIRAAGGHEVREHVEASTGDQASSGMPSGAESRGIASAVNTVVAAIGQRLGLKRPEAIQVAEKIESPPALENSSGPAPESGKPVSRLRRPIKEARESTLAAVNAALIEPPPDMTASEPAVTSPEPVVPINDQIIYTSRSPGVIAAEGKRPQLPSVTPTSPGAVPGALRGIELLIRPDGSVESVKLIGPPRDIHDSMLLSAAKAWRFYPATKDGIPVRYRKTVWIPKEMWGQD